MASTGKKVKKHKGKTIALTAFLADLKTEPGRGRVVGRRRAWADEVETSDDASFSKHGQYPVVLPTAPRETRSPRDIDDATIPMNPPYKAYLVNLHYDTKEEDVVEFFGDMKIVDVQLPRDDRGSGRLKGFGYIEFDTRENLLTALAMEDTTIKGRRMRIEVSTNSNEGGGSERQYGSYGWRYENNDLGPDRTQADWRSGPRTESTQAERPHFFVRNAAEGTKDRGSFTRDNMDCMPDHCPKSGNFFNRESMMGTRDRERGLSDRGYLSRGLVSSGLYDRTGDRHERNGGYGKKQQTREFVSSGYDSGPRGRDDGFRGFSNVQQGRDRPTEWTRNTNGNNERKHIGRWKPGEQISRSEDTKPEDLKIRPKLKLTQRTICNTKEEDVAPIPASIFGEARPVDTAAREREVERRHAEQQKQAEDKLMENTNKGNGADWYPTLDSTLCEGDLTETSNSEDRDKYHAEQLAGENVIEGHGQYLEEKDSKGKWEMLDPARAQEDACCFGPLNSGEEDFDDGYNPHCELQSGFTEHSDNENCDILSKKQGDREKVQKSNTSFKPNTVGEEPSGDTKIERWEAEQKSTTGEKAGERKDFGNDLYNRPIRTNLQQHVKHDSSIVKRAPIFGEAKPIDTSIREKEIEERNAGTRRKPKPGNESSGNKHFEKTGLNISEKKFEPAQPPAENIWHRRASQHVANKDQDQTDISISGVD